MRINNIFLLLAFLMITLSAACDRVEAILFTDVIIPGDPVVVEEEDPQFLLRHSLGDLMAEDTTGRAFYSDEFGWFEFSNNGNPYSECVVDAGSFSFGSSVTPIPGGNSENARFSVSGRALNIDLPIGADLVYEIGEPSEPGFDYFTASSCAPLPELIISELTDTYISGRVTGTLLSILGSSDCDSPDAVLRDVDIEFVLPRRDCE